MSKTYRIAVIPGDGIGKETVPESLRVLDAAARRFNFSLKLDEYDWSCETYKKTCLLYTSPSPRDRQKSRMPSSA